MVDRSITDATFAEAYLDRKSAKTARRVIVADRIPYQKVRGHWLIKQSDAEAWRTARMQTPTAPTLKSLLAEIAKRTLDERRRERGV